MALQYRIHPVTAFEQNCTLVWCDQTRDAALLDPGGDVDRLLGAVDQQGLNLCKVWLTHAHIDHAGGVAELIGKRPVPVEGPHENDQFWISAMAQQSEMLGLPPAKGFQVDRWLREGDTVQLGKETLSILHCPGHSPGQVAFHHADSNWAQVGDALFQGSIGRTDLPGGDYATAIETVVEKLFPLGDHLCVTPGHGPETTVGEERANNPFFRDL